MVRRTERDSMEQHHLHRARRAAALFAAALLGLGLAAAPGATAKPTVTMTRLAGTDRFETATEVAKAAFPTGSDTVVVASGRSFPDALAGAALGLPVLLTESTFLPESTAAAIDDLGATHAIILGGTASVDEQVQHSIDQHVDDTTRLAGNDRYATAADTATSVGSSNIGTVDGKKTAIIATGHDFADALAGGPLATGGTKTLPVLLVGDDVPQPTSDALDALGIEQVLILGGTGAVPTSVQTEL